jgi:hypothetical protein
VRWLLAAAATAILVAGCGEEGKPLPKAPGGISIRSDFAEGATIPTRHTCSGEGTPPPLSWSGVPAAADRLELLVQDPDADNYEHWKLTDLPPAARAVPQGTTKGWRPPCPPKGDDPHHYVFALYAYDGDRALASGRLTGTFGR